MRLAAEACTDRAVASRLRLVSLRAKALAGLPDPSQPPARLSVQILQKLAGKPQIRRVEAFGKSAKNRGQQGASRIPFALLLPAPGHADRCAQRQRLGLLPPADRQGLRETGFSLAFIGRAQAE